MFDGKTDELKLNHEPDKDGVSDGDFQKYLSEENTPKARGISAAPETAKHGADESAGESVPGDKTEKLDAIIASAFSEIKPSDAASKESGAAAGEEASEDPPAEKLEEAAAAGRMPKGPENAAGDALEEETEEEPGETDGPEEEHSEGEDTTEKIPPEKDSEGNTSDEGASDEGTSDQTAPENGNAAAAPAGTGKAGKRRGRGKRGKKKRTKWFWIRLVIIIAAIIAALVGGLFYAFYYGAGLVQMQRVDSKTFGDELFINDWVRSNADMDGYTNIALFGVDSRDDDLLGGNNRSDIIMIVSIHNRTGKVKVVSLYRDTYIDVGYGEYDKANTAYAYGGPMQAVNMMNMNLDLNITDFATFGFKGVIDAIDELGGVDIDVQEEEVEYINMYLQTMHDEIGSENNPISGPGMQHLDGAQATAYARIRYTQGGDFHRTERQREVLQQIFQKASDCSPRTLINVCNRLSDEVATSLSNTEIMELIVKMLYMKIDDTAGFPVEEYREPATLRGRSIVIPDTLSDNVKWLHGYLFEEEPYYTSQLVEDISSMIERKTTYAIADDDPILQNMQEDDSSSEHSTAEPSADLGNTGNTAQTSEEAYTGAAQ